MREIFNITVPWIEEILPFRTRQVNCLLCGKRNIIPLNTFVLNGKRFYTTRCLSDGMMWLDPQPTKEFYQRLYTEHYHLGEPDDPLLEQATLDVHSDEEKRREIAILRLNEIEKFVKTGHLLEVGFGSGHVLMEAKARNWDVFGVELAPSCVNAVKAKGISAMCIDFPIYKQKHNSFDVIAMYSVIEHVHEPIQYLQNAYKLLRRNGVFVLRLPNTQDEGPPASLIAHLYHFNKATISELLKRCGFKILEIGSWALWRPKKYPGELWSMTIFNQKT